MQRCIQLARLGAGNVAPNPMVGAVLVHQGRVIGEGFHAHYGQAHAEVNCIASVQPEDRALIKDSILYVSLEPCAHFGKTPPCADLIVANKIRQVVIGCRDPFPAVNGKGVEKLLAAGVQVDIGVEEKAVQWLNRRFFTFHRLRRPYIILKWAQTENGYIGSHTTERLLISNWHSNQLVHKWRGEEQAIMIGTQTAAVDNPALTTRLWPGPNPIRVVVDMALKLPASLQVFDGQAATLVFNKYRNTIDDFSNRHFLDGKEVGYYQVTADVDLVPQVLNALYHLNIQSVLIEGGARLLRSFIDCGCWDEARVITNSRPLIREGIPAPVLNTSKLMDKQIFQDDTIQYFLNPAHPL